MICPELTIHSFQTGILGMFMIQLLFYDCGGQIYGTLNYINIQGFKYAALRANVNLSEDWEWASFTRHVSLLQPCKTSNCPTIETNMGLTLSFTEERKTF